MCLCVRGPSLFHTYLRHGFAFCTLSLPAHSGSGCPLSHCVLIEMLASFVYSCIITYSKTQFAHSITNIFPSPIHYRPEDGGEECICHVTWHVPSDVGLTEDVMTARVASTIKDVRDRAGMVVGSRHVYQTVCMSISLAHTRDHRMTAGGAVCVGWRADAHRIHPRESRWVCGRVGVRVYADVWVYACGCVCVESVFCRPCHPAISCIDIPPRITLHDTTPCHTPSHPVPPRDVRRQARAGAQLGKEGPGGFLRGEIIIYRRDPALATLQPSPQYQ